MHKSTANQASAKTIDQRIPTIFLQLVALLILSLPQPLFAIEALSLEGHTGLWNVPSALVMPDQSYALAWNTHHNDSFYNHDQNIMIAAGVLPGLEAVFRYGFPDLSLNLKYGRCLHQTPDQEPNLSEYTRVSKQYQGQPLQSSAAEWNTCAAIGVQDIWGGASFFHSKYAVLSQRLPGGVWAHIGWGTGPNQKSGDQRASAKRLDGFFAGTELPLFPWPGLQDSTQYNSRISAIADYDRTLLTAGVRTSYLTPWFVLTGDVSRNMNSDLPFEWQHNEYSMQIRVPLNGKVDSVTNIKLAYTDSAYFTRFDPHQSRLFSRVKPRPFSTRPILELVPVPDLNSYLGTEVGLFDYQFLLDADAIVNITPAMRWNNRVEFPLHHTENLDDGKAFASRRRDDINWEASLLEWTWTDNPKFHEWSDPSSVISRGFSSVLFAGFVNYDWGGAFLLNELRLGSWSLGSSAGAFWQQIPGSLSETSESTRTQLLFRVSHFDQGVSGLSFHLQAGRFFLAQDYGARLITRRRAGPLEWEAIAGISSIEIDNWHWQGIQDDLHFTLEGRMRFYFDLSTPKHKAIVLRAPNSWSYGFRTELSREQGDHNRIRTAPVRTADVPGQETSLW